jgi:hypothetical protein
MIVSGEHNKVLKRAGAYAKRCAEFADSMGWNVDTIVQWWEQFSLMRIKESGWPRPLAEWMAWRDVVAFFDKRGQAEPD